jgi:hypothetical protein
MNDLWDKDGKAAVQGVVSANIWGSVGHTGFVLWTCFGGDERVKYRAYIRRQ